MLAPSLSHSRLRRLRAFKSSSFHSRISALTWTLTSSLLLSGPPTKKILKRRSWSLSTVLASTASQINWKLPQTNFLFWRCKWKWTLTFCWMRTRWIKKCWRTLWTSYLWPDSRTPKCCSASSLASVLSTELKCANPDMKWCDGHQYM